MEHKFQEYQYELKKNNRFIVEFPEEFNMPAYFVKSINRPTFYINDNENWWGHIKIEFYDPIGPSMSQSLYKLISKYMQKINNEDHLFEINVMMLDPTNEIVETWNIKVKNIFEMNFGDLDMENNDPTILSMTIEPKSCSLVF